ncbi:transcriptional regulatory protein ZraR [bacterium BMS3Bbin03]|nr:transcriptional regulatory protein ZraR [bacterium BMS3Bbin03]
MKKQYDVLIVDDEPEILQLLEILLTRKGFHVRTAENGMDAFVKLEQNHFSVLLTDIKMPAMDGMKLIEIAKRDFPEVKILVFTGFGAMDTEQKALRMGASKYFLKPLPMEDLLSELKSACDSEN